MADTLGQGGPFVKSEFCIFGALASTLPEADAALLGAAALIWQELQ